MASVLNRFYRPSFCLGVGCGASVARVVQRGADPSLFPGPLPTVLGLRREPQLGKADAEPRADAVGRAGQGASRATDEHEELVVGIVLAATYASTIAPDRQARPIRRCPPWIVGPGPGGTRATRVRRVSHNQDVAGHGSGGALRRGPAVGSAGTVLATVVDVRSHRRPRIQHLLEAVVDVDLDLDPVERRG